jgi:hypothetical protein
MFSSHGIYIYTWKKRLTYRKIKISVEIINWKEEISFGLVYDLHLQDKAKAIRPYHISFVGYLCVM